MTEEGNTPELGDSMHRLLQAAKADAGGMHVTRAAKLTRKLTRGLTAAQRHQFHKKLQEWYGHYWPYAPAPLKPTGWQRTYRAARRNALRARRMLHG